jgi:hypothetical protein
MRKISVLVLSILSTGCASMPDQKHDNMQTVKLVVGAVALVAIANALGDSNQKSKCANNRAGFWVDNTTGKTYTC